MFGWSRAQAFRFQFVNEKQEKLENIFPPKNNKRFSPFFDRLHASIFFFVWLMVIIVYRKW